MKYIFSYLLVILTVVSSGCFSHQYAKHVDGSRKTLFRATALMGKTNAPYVLAGKCSVFETSQFRDGSVVGTPFSSYVVVEDAFMEKIRERSIEKKGHDLAFASSAFEFAFKDPNYRPLTEAPEGYTEIEKMPPKWFCQIYFNEHKVSYYEKPNNLFWTVPLDVVTSPVQAIGILAHKLAESFVLLFWSDG
jgi:hypothetical protein